MLIVSSVDLSTCLQTILSIHQMLLEEIYCKYFVVKAVRYNNVTQVAQRFRVFVIDHIPL
jgi:hypothetical protein